MITRLLRLGLRRCFAAYTIQDIEGLVFDTLKAVDKVERSKISREATFDQLGLDSLDQVEVVVALEEKLGIDLPDNEAEKISSVSDAVNTFKRFAK